VHIKKEDSCCDELDEDVEEDELGQAQARTRANGGTSAGGSSIDEVDMECDNDGSDAEATFDWPLQHQICIDEDFRQEAVEWILDIVPPEFRTKPTVGKHLRDQLTTSTDTRWHAAQIFNRYFIRIASSPPSSPHSQYGNFTDGQKVSSENERAGFVWDIALACLALSVKFHRDVLGPFFPVLADEFIIIASHEIEYDDLEAAQREVLTNFNFCIGSITPGAYIQELWDALPSLRELLSFKGAYEAVQRAAWEILYDALFELSYLKFGTALLTACALTHGVVDTLILKARVDATILLQNKTERWRSRRGARCDCAQTRKTAKKKAKDVEADIREVLGVKTEDWDECWQWLAMLLDGR